MANRETRKAFLSLLSQIHKHYKIKQPGFVLKSMQSNEFEKTDNYHSSGNISQDFKISIVA